MKRYLPSRRSRSNISNTSAIGDQLIREFTQQAQAVMEELSAQFTETLQTQAAQALQNQVLPGITPTADIGDDFAGADDNVNFIGGIGQLLGTGARYLVSRPRTSHDSAETSRSIDAASQFRVSSAQAAAEAQQALGKGDKNL